MDSVFAEHFLNWSQICFKTLHLMNSLTVNLELFCFCALVLQHTKIAWENAKWITIRKKITQSLLPYFSIYGNCYSKCTSVANALFISLTFIEATVCDKVWPPEHSLSFISKLFLIPVCVSNYCKWDRHAVLVSHRAILPNMLCFSQLVVWAESFL